MVVIIVIIIIIIIIIKIPKVTRKIWINRDWNLNKFCEKFYVLIKIIFKI